MSASRPPRPSSPPIARAPRALPVALDPEATGDMPRPELDADPQFEASAPDIDDPEDTVRAARRPGTRAPETASEGPPRGSSRTYRILVQRAIRADLDPIEILPEEAPAFDIDQAHGGSEPLKRILAWRRAALFMAFLFQLPPVLVRFVKAAIAVGHGQQDALAGVEFLLVLLEVGVLIALLVSMRRWASWRRSRRILMVAWAASFVAPFVLALLPLRTIVTQGAALPDEAALAAGMLFGLAVFIELAPKILALIPGILRAAIIAKAAFPTSPMPGWLMMVAAPFDALLMCAVLAIPYQMEAGGWMIPALLLLTIAPVFFYFGGKRLAAPQTLDEALQRIAQTRKWALSFNVIGGVCLLIALSVTLGRVEIAGHRLFSVVDAFMPVISLIAGIFVLEVIGVDILLGAMIKLYDAQRVADNAGARDAYEAEMGTLVAAIRANG